MSKDDRPAALPEEEVRALINRWNDQRSFHIKYLGDKIFITEIVPQSSYNLRLNTHYEERTVRTVTEAFPGGQIDDQGTPPGPWDIEVRRPRDFEERTDQIPIPHTERVSVCPKCAGDGKVVCSSCTGTGQVNCPQCGGRGYRERQEFRSERDAQGNMVQRPETVRESCSCMAGRVTCSSCSGNGRRVCPTCNGSGCVKSYEQLTVRFHCEELAETLDETDLPDNLVAGVSGQVLVDQQAPRLERFPDVMPEVDPRGKAMVGKSQDVDERHSHILRQHLCVERVPIHEVHYKYAGAEYRLWIYGDEQRVHAPGAPWLWKKMAGIVAGVVAGVVLLIVLAVIVFTR